MALWTKLHGEKDFRASTSRQVRDRLGAFAMILVFGFNGPAAAQVWSGFNSGQSEGLRDEEWYDPGGWVDLDEGISLASDDWLNFGYGYGDSGADNDSYGLGPAFDDDPYTTDDFHVGIDAYYTERWHEGDGVFEGWFD